MWERLPGSPGARPCRPVRLDYLQRLKIGQIITSESFVVWEVRQKLRFGFDGHVARAMTGGRVAHSSNQTNPLRSLSNALFGGRGSAGIADLGAQCTEYQGLPSLKPYVVLHLAEIFQRDPDGEWSYEFLTADRGLEMPEAGISIPVLDIYEDAEFAS